MSTADSRAGSAIGLAPISGGGPRRRSRSRCRARRTTPRLVAGRGPRRPGPPALGLPAQADLAVVDLGLHVRAPQGLDGLRRQGDLPLLVQPADRMALVHALAVADPHASVGLLR